MRTAIFVVLAAAFGGCAFVPGIGGAKGPSMNVSSAQPAAEAHVAFGKEANGNTSIDLSVKHLADPAKLTPPAAVYVVWLRPDKDAPAQNIGALTVDKDLTGTLNTVTAMKAFDLFVTAEPTSQVQRPTGEPMLWTSHGGGAGR